MRLVVYNCPIGSITFLQDENIEDNVELARDFGKAIYENVMIKAKEIDGKI